MTANASYPINSASVKSASDGVDIKKLISDVESSGEKSSSTQTVISGLTDPGGQVHRAMPSAQKDAHVDEFKLRLLQWVADIETRTKKPIAKDENGRDLYSVFDFADLFVLLDTLAGCMPCTSVDQSEGNRFACFMSCYFPPMDAAGNTISFANAKYLYAAGRCGLLHNLGGKPGQKKLSYTHGTGPFWVKIDNQNGKMDFTLYAGQFCMAIKHAINKAFAIDSFRSGVNQRLERQDWIVALN